jgi:hypothetical protein
VVLTVPLATWERRVSVSDGFPTLTPAPAALPAR